MFSSIRNDYLDISVRHFGSVLSSVKSQKSGYEFLWQGNHEVWDGRSPILFPIIGRLLDDKYMLNGKQYSIIRHGFARHNDFDLFSQTDNELVFVQYENNETFECYPYGYKLYVSFKIDDNKLTVTHTVKNRNDDNMYFSIGAHPAFNCNIGDRIVFEKRETLYSERINTEAIITDDKDLILDNNDTIQIEKNTFDKDAIIFSELESDYVTLLKQGNRKIKFSINKAPFFAIWAKPNSEFVCLEPWYGINDSYEKVNDISQKRGIVCLAPHGKFSFSWTAEFIEE